MPAKWPPHGTRIAASRLGIFGGRSTPCPWSIEAVAAQEQEPTVAKRTFLDFEQPIAELESKIEELRYVQTESAVDISEEIDRLDKKSLQLTKAIYSSLQPW